MSAKGPRQNSYKQCAVGGPSIEGMLRIARCWRRRGLGGLVLARLSLGEPQRVTQGKARFRNAPRVTRNEPLELSYTLQLFAEAN